MSSESFILAVDVGSTSIRCHIYDKEARIRGSCSQKVTLLYPQPGWVEMDPEELWQSFLSVVKGAVRDSGLQMRQMKSLGISTQRGTFTTWDRKTGKHFHNFISWQDLRAVELVNQWNRSCTMKAVHGVMKVLHFLTRHKRFQAASLVVFSTQHVTFRLAWVLCNSAQVRQAVHDGTCCFGTIDTWLLFKLTKGAVHSTDYSNASSTGIFDSYQMCWSSFLCSLVSLPLSIFPTVEDSGYRFSTVDPRIFGVPVPIMCVMADQQAAMFGECCFNAGDVKITMGTGTFMDINTGSKPHTSVSGLYPLVGWKVGPDLVYLAEGNAAATGAAIRWAQELVACRACASFMGLKASTNRSHLVRAILESVAFRNKQLYDVMLKETRIPVGKIRADGGVCTNDFIMQMTADLLGKKLERPNHFDMSSLGSAFMAGLTAGFWGNREELKRLRGTEQVFEPRARPGQYTDALEDWDRAVTRSMYWYSGTL